jgi:hypothetical protein
MASCKLGHIYIIETVLSKEPKAKFALCVCVSEEYFVWINTRARHDGRDQLALAPGCHELVRHPSFLDLSRIVKHPSWELEEAREFSCISADLARSIVSRIDQGLDLLPVRHATLITTNLQTIL